MTQEVRQSAATGPEPRLNGVRNFRDVGGLPTADGRRVRPGVLFRSGHLAHADAQDTAFLASLGLHTIFDFRNGDDIALEGPDVVLPGTRSINMPLSDPAQNAGFWRTVRDGDLAALQAALGDGRAAERMAASYRKLIVERTAEHGRMLALLAGPAEQDATVDGALGEALDGATDGAVDREPAVPALLHCAAGKDRAGTSIAVILLALGVERSAIEADYLESNARHRRYKVVRGDGTTGTAIDPAVRELLDPLFEARIEYLRSAFDTIEERWGTVDRYLEAGLALTPAGRLRLQARLLTA
ncbi:protein-tyrosine phosphatase [Actinacidiphila yanglinensis]|uniref:Protein-tyrosine phosphatase n=1 Tax=Actinacidiphila yanglinensis TaxID=310779 RepID=A0A1H5Y137_9ACTN|nr:tyrosine-protein phosphatase [Actinacidiphila yanglinensis]SEG17681.1 protein-tyrosine phosphatase [Actinacidiphila yanglinensis]